jgi:SAM-dependent methyltransferase
MSIEQNNSKTASANDSEQWSAVARQWEQIGQPLRPTAQDLDFVSAAIGTWVSQHHTPRALVLGVTPELYNLPWPLGTDILAIDHTQAMIDAVWPGPKDAAICAEWTEMPLPDSSRDIVLCDGGVILLHYPDDHRKFVDQLSRIIAPGGLCILRLFVPPEEREDIESVFRDLLESRIANLNLLKLRLGMAMQPSASQGIQPRQVWNAIHQVAPDLDHLAERIGWPIEHLLAINAYRDRATSYHFLSIQQVLELFCTTQAGFEHESTHIPDYELGERCPTLVLRRLQ